MKVLLTLLAMCFGITALSASPAKEIEALLAVVTEMKDASFIRNGGSHGGKEAAAHLRMKWDKQKDKIKTAEEFITLCATKSYLSGERYKIRFKDGTEKFSSDYFTEELKKLRRKEAKP